MKKTVFNLIALMALALGSLTSSATPILISGCVTDAQSGQALPGAIVLEKGSKNQTQTDAAGLYQITVTSGTAILHFSCEGYRLEEVTLRGRTTLNVKLQPNQQQVILESEADDELVVLGYGTTKRSKPASSQPTYYDMAAPTSLGFAMAGETRNTNYNTEGYSTIHENGFHSVSLNPLSTFSIDVDVASYANMRRFINNGQNPPTDAVRIEEMINYFRYDYPQPDGKHPITVNTELSQCPWNTDHLVLQVGIQGKSIETENLPASNLVFLLDVSGSMESPNKLPLLKSAFKLLVNELRPQDRVAIVVYAGASGLVLPSTPGNQKQTIIDALDRLEAGGSTAGAAGLLQAYQVAETHFMENGNNRIILATDGDFNVGMSSNAEMERLVEREREKGIGISVLGFGMGNYKDDKMELIADKGNGNYAYIDNLQEARKVLVSEMGGTLYTIAKDVKIQLEFNPVQIASYRLIGYENRLLNEEDFDNDRVDAGEMGAGHTVTALYELVPNRENDNRAPALVYQTPLTNNRALSSNELLILKLRYKQPDSFDSQLLETTVTNSPIAPNKTSANFKLAVAVAEFGMCLRESEHRGTSTLNTALELAIQSKGNDKNGYRSEFIQLIKMAQTL